MFSWRMVSFFLFRNLGTTPILKKRLSERKDHCRSNSRNPGAFSEQFSEWRSRPDLCENPILGATLGATLGIGWTPKFQPKLSERFFKIGVVPARQVYARFESTPEELHGPMPARLKIGMVQRRAYPQRAYGKRTESQDQESPRQTKPKK